MAETQSSTGPPDEPKDEPAAATGATSPGGTGGGGGTMTWLLPALTFIAGVALGAVVVAVGSSGNDGGGTTASPPTPAPAPVGPSPARSDLVVKIPGVCLDAIDSAEEATREVDDLVSAVRAFDAARLQALVDRFQELEVTIRASAEGCREVTGERLEDGVGAPSPTAAP